ncbi:MAG: hypothetical protein LUI13_06865 [Lachnospiraceae bacterium]|nr:hypothetical protein [Lachnospiraceae bacterium]
MNEVICLIYEEEVRGEVLNPRHCLLKEMLYMALAEYAAEMDDGYGK